MPDISKLPELAEIFGVTLDELLGERSSFAEAAVNDRIEEYIMNQSPSAEEVDAVLPILKPTQVDTIVANADKLDWKAISGMLPFMDEEDVKEFALRAMEQGESIEGYLPFMDEDDVKEFALRTKEQGKAIGAYLPFMDEDDVKEFALQAMERGEGVDGYLPFMYEDDVKELAVMLLKKSNR